MSLTETEKHWLCGCAAATAASRSDVNVAMPHLRGKWSPTKAILRTLEFSFIQQRFPSAVCQGTLSARGDNPVWGEQTKLNGAGDLKRLGCPAGPRRRTGDIGGGA